MKPWIEAMRLRTLPVSVAGVAAGTGCAVYHHGFSLIPMLICLTFAIVAQIASNFANEYYDFKNGLDKKGREGYRRGVTEGDIRPESMKLATFLLLTLDSILGCTLIIWGGWWLVPVGIAIALFALGYSTGPYPLSHHGFGDIAVIIFFGFVPVIFTEYVQAQVLRLDTTTFCTALGVGLLATNVLIVNNYRDYEDDKKVGKNTTVVIFGRKTMTCVYWMNGIGAAICFIIATMNYSFLDGIWIFLAVAVASLTTQLHKRRGTALNVILKYSSILLLLSSIALLIIFIFGHPSGI